MRTPTPIPPSTTRSLYRAAGHGNTSLVLSLVRKHGRQILAPPARQPSTPDDNEREGDKESHREEWSVLHYAAACGKTKVVKLLLRLGMDVNLKTPTTLDTPLHIALAFDRKRTARSLFKRKAGLHILNANHISPLDMMRAKQSPSSPSPSSSSRIDNTHVSANNVVYQDEEESFSSSGSSSSSSSSSRPRSPSPARKGKENEEEDIENFDDLSKWFAHTTTSTSVIPAISSGSISRFKLTRRGSIGRKQTPKSESSSSVLVSSVSASDSYVAPFPIVTPDDDPPVSLRKLREALKDKVEVYAKHADEPELEVDQDALFIVSLKAADGSSKKIQVHGSLTGEELENMCCARANLTGPEAELMELVVLDPVDGVSITTYVYDPEPISNQGIGPGSLLFLRVKHFKIPVSASIPMMKVLQEQLAANMMDGSMLVSERLAIRLAGFQLVISNGPFRANNFFKGFLSDSDTLAYFLPSSLIPRYPTELWEDRLLDAYARCGEMELQDALSAYLDTAQQSPNYGATSFKARVRKNGLYATLGVAQDGVYVDIVSGVTAFFGLYRSRGATRHLPNILGWSGDGSGSVTLLLREGRPDAPIKPMVFDIVGGEDLAVELIDLLSGYYILLVYSDALYDHPILVLDEKDWPLPREPLPLRLPCKLAADRKPDLPYSDLDWFVEHYFHLSTAESIPPLVAIFPAIHTSIDHDEAWETLSISDPTATSAQLRVLSVAFRDLAAIDPTAFGIPGRVVVDHISFARASLGSSKDRLGSAVELLASIGKAFPVSVLDVSFCALSQPAHYERLSASMAFLAPLNSLILDSNVLAGNDSVAALKRGMWVANQDLKTISASHCGMDDAAIVSLGSRLYQDNSTITALDVSHNKISDFGFERGILVNLRNGTTLNELNVSHNPVSSSSTSALLEKLQDVSLYSIKLGDFNLKSKHIPGIIERLGHIGELDLSDNSLGKGVISLAEALASNATVRFLNLSGVGLSSKALNALIEFLPQNRHLVDLRLARNSLSSNATLNLIPSLAVSPTLRTLDLSGNSLGKKFGRGLADALDGTSCSLRTLILANNSLGPSGVEGLASTLSSLPELTNLDLSDTSCEDRGAIAIACALKGNATLRFLSIPGNYITEPGLYDVLDAIQDNQGLRNVNATRNALFSSHDFETRLSQFKTLIDIDVSFNDASTSTRVTHVLSSWSHKFGLI